MPKKARALYRRPPMKYTMMMSTVGRAKSMGRSDRERAR
jgi:hypothetical protein